MSPEEAGWINKLRSEHINLKEYENFYFKSQNTRFGLCTQCTNIAKETVKHYILECDRFKNERSRLYKKLRRIDVKFKNIDKIKLKDIIFPHTWQKENQEEVRVEKNELFNNINKRTKIIKTIIKYINDTKRFENGNIP